MSADLIGTGGGYGKNAGIPLDEIRRRFDLCVADPSMRSVSAVLRIAREQLEARGSLGSYRGLSVFFASMGVVALGVSFAMKGDLAEKIRTGGYFALGVAALLLLGILQVRHAARASRAQEAEIRRLTIEALERIVASPEFKPKPLDWTQSLVLSRIMKATGNRNPVLVELVQSSE